MFGPVNISLSDCLELAKPRITAVVVAAANVLNMYLERETDALMPRTMHRPLPAGRMNPSLALGFGLLLAAVSVPLLFLGVGPLPGLLALIALVSYVLIYTPMKRYTAAALLVGAVAGAIPPLIGWTAATGRLDLPGVLLFAVMFLWQVPHFLAITLFRKDEYARAGLVVQPNEPGGDRAARMNIVRYSVALLAVSLLFVPIGAAHALYLATALSAGLGFLAYGLLGLREGAGPRWARNLFFLSLIYLPVVFGALMVDHG